MAASPVQPASGVSGRVRAPEGASEQAPDLRDRQRDHPGIRRRSLVRDEGWRDLGIGAVAQQRGGDRADRQRGYHQHDVADDRGIEPGLALIQA